MRIFLLITSTIFFMTGCSSGYLDLNILSNINHELTFDQTQEKYSEFRSEMTTKEMEISGKQYQQLTLKFVTSTHHENMPGNNYPVAQLFGGGMNGRVDKFMKSNFYILYKEGKYLFSGFQYQFKLYANEETKNIFLKMNGLEDE